jgi:hypothetical protein
MVSWFASWFKMFYAFQKKNCSCFIISFTIHFFIYFILIIVYKCLDFEEKFLGHQQLKLIPNIL